MASLPDPEDSERLGPSISALVRRWSAPVSGFRPWRLDPCLLAAFEKRSQESESFVHFAFSSMAAFSAATHAISHASAYTDKFLRNLASVLSKPAWTSFCEDAKKAFTNDVLFPL